MVEMLKILNLFKIVLIFDMEVGCFLVESIIVEGIEEMCCCYLGVLVVSYVNIIVEVKVVLDICCILLNVVQIVGVMDSDMVIMMLDQYFVQNVVWDVFYKNVVWWEGFCIVYEQYIVKDI